jgi:hypothetical protein
MISTTNPSAFDHESLNRFFTLFLDESREQTQAILTHQQRMAGPDKIRMKMDRGRIQKLHCNVQRLLKPVLVLNKIGTGILYPADVLNTRRENTQAYLIPLLTAAGFNVIADNCDAACVFQQRLPSLDYDLGMYISTAPSDPGYLTPAFHCDQIPGPENNNQGQNSQGWCDEAASEALTQADATVDETARADLIKSALEAMSNPDNLLMLPLMQFPKSGAYRTDKVGPAEVVEKEFQNYRAWNNFYEWQDLDGDGQIVVGAEQWPECLNPVTECANSSWMVWTTAFPFWPGVWDTTADGRYEITNIVTGEPVVDIPG